MDAVERAVAETHRREWSAVLASTVRVTRDIDLAEEVVQEAYVTALDVWARNGVPARPGAWLTTVARRKALDGLRRARSFQSKMHLLVEPNVVEEHVPVETPVGDDQLRLVFMCSHPALAVEAQVALTLRLVCGVSTPDIAAAFLVSEATMAARITRAKKKIASAGIPFRMPDAVELPDRLDAVLTVVHLLHTTGHAAPSGESLTRDALSERAIDLARLLLDLMPDEREVRGLLALLLVNHARRATRTSADGRLLRLEEQDRSAWDRAAIDEGHHLVLAALRGGRPGRFALQAAIAALHATAPTYADTDWAQIIVLYDALLEVWPSPVVALNRAVALAMHDGPEAGLREVERLEQEDQLTGYRFLPAIKADFLLRLDRRQEAATYYQQALDLTDNATERRFLKDRLTQCAMP